MDHLPQDFIQCFNVKKNLYMHFRLIYLYSAYADRVPLHGGPTTHVSHDLARL